MAKAAGAAKPKSKAKAMPVKRASKGSSASCSNGAVGSSGLIEQAWAEEAAASSARPGRTLQRRRTEDSVQKALKDNFPTFGACEVDSCLVDGLSLRETLTRDKRRQRSEGLVMGAGYKLMREKFMGDCNTRKQLVVEQKDLPVQPALRTALCALKGGNASKAHLLAWCSSAKEINERELVGLYKVALYMKPTASAGQLQMVMAILAMVKRMEAHRRWPGHWSLVAGAFDRALVAAFDRLKKGNVGPTEFWKLYGEESSVIINSETVVKVLGCKTRFIDVAAELAQLVQSSCIGKRMFVKAHATVLSERVSDDMAAKLETLKEAEINSKTLFDMANDIKEKLAPRPDLDLLPSRREAKVCYRGQQIKLASRTLHEEWTTRLYCAIKETAVKRGLIAELLVEQHLCGAPVERVGPIDESVIKGMAAARRQFNELLDEDQACDAAALKHLCKSKEGFFLTIDPSFALELQLMEQMCGQQGEERLKAQLLAELPQEGTCPAKIVATVLAQVTMLLNGKLMKMQSVGFQGQCSSVKEFLDLLAMGRQPAVDAKASPFVAQCAALLPNFIMVQEGEQGENIWGKKAIQYLYKQGESASKEGSWPSNLSDISPLVCYGWTLTPCQRKKVQEWTTQVLQASGILVQVDKSASGAAKGGLAAERLKRKKAETTEELVDEYFA